MSTYSVLRFFRFLKAPGWMALMRLKRKSLESKGESLNPSVTCGLYVCRRWRTSDPHVKPKCASKILSAESLVQVSHTPLTCDRLVHGTEK